MMKKQAKKAVEKAHTGLSRGLGLPILVEGGNFISNFIRRFFKKSNIEQRETFEQAASRLHLTDADFQKQISRYWKQFWVFVGFGSLVFIYTVYLFFINAWSPGLVSLLAALLLFAYALRTHFWIFQIKNKKLGCSLKEWWNNKVEDTHTQIKP